jgi:hypothetical protein
VVVIFPIKKLNFFWKTQRYTLLRMEEVGRKSAFTSFSWEKKTDLCSYNVETVERKQDPTSTYTHLAKSTIGQETKNATPCVPQIVMQNNIFPRSSLCFLVSSELAHLPSWHPLPPPTCLYNASRGRRSRWPALLLLHISPSVWSTFSSLCPTHCAIWSGHSLSTRTTELPRDKYSSLRGGYIDCHELPYCMEMSLGVPLLLHRTHWTPGSSTGGTQAPYK